jgi:hypothetical protein
MEFYISFDVYMISFASYYDNLSEFVIYLFVFIHDRNIFDVFDNDFINYYKDYICFG